MKKIVILLATILITVTTYFSTNSFAENLNVSNSEVNTPEWLLSVPGRIDPNNPDLENLPPSQVTFFDDQDFNTRDTKPIVGGAGHTYLNKDGLYWDGTSATTLDEVAASYSVHGVLYRQDKGSTKLVELDTDSEIAYFSKGMVVSQTTGKTGVVGSTMIAEGIHYVNLGLVNDTKVTTEKKEVK